MFGTAEEASKTGAHPTTQSQLSCHFVLQGKVVNAPRKKKSIGMNNSNDKE